MSKPKDPPRICLGGEYYRMTVFLIHTKHPDGSPALCKLIPDDHEVSLAGDEEFMTAFVPESMVPTARRGGG